MLLQTAAAQLKAALTIFLFVSFIFFRPEIRTHSGPSGFSAKDRLHAGLGFSHSSAANQWEQPPHVYNRNGREAAAAAALGVSFHLGRGVGKERPDHQQTTLSGHH